MAQNIVCLLHQLPEKLKTYYKKYENTYEMKINKMWSLIFNKTSLKKTCGQLSQLYLLMNYFVYLIDKNVKIIYYDNIS